MGTGTGTQREPIARTAAASNVRYLVDYAVARGLPRDDVVTRFEIDREQLHDIDGRIPLATLVRMWRELPDLTGDPDMALNVVESAIQAERPLALGWPARP